MPASRGGPPHEADPGAQTGRADDLSAVNPRLELEARATQWRWSTHHHRDAGPPATARTGQSSAGRNAAGPEGLPTA